MTTVIVNGKSVPLQKCSRFNIEILEDRIAPSGLSLAFRNNLRTAVVGQGVISVGNGNMIVTQINNFH